VHPKAGTMDVQEKLSRSAAMVEFSVLELISPGPRITPNLLPRGVQRIVVPIGRAILLVHNTTGS
jgi:hypothetical protein